MMLLPMRFAGREGERAEDGGRGGEMPDPMSMPFEKVKKLGSEEDEDGSKGGDCAEGGDEGRLDGGGPVVD